MACAKDFADMLFPAFLGAGYAGSRAAATVCLNVSGAYMPQAVIHQESSAQVSSLFDADAHGNQVFQLATRLYHHDLRDGVEFGPQHDFFDFTGQLAGIDLD